MKQHNRINKVLNSLDGMQRAKAPGDGFAKIQQRLAEQRMQQAMARPDTGFEWIKVAAAVALVVIVNIWAVANFITSDTKAAPKSGNYAELTTDLNLYRNE